MQIFITEHVRMVKKYEGHATYFRNSKAVKISPSWMSRYKSLLINTPGYFILHIYAYLPLRGMSEGTRDPSETCGRATTWKRPLGIYKYEGDEIIYVEWSFLIIL